MIQELLRWRRGGRGSWVRRRAGGLRCAGGLVVAVTLATRLAEFGAGAGREMLEAGGRAPEFAQQAGVDAGAFWVPFGRIRLAVCW